MPLYEYLCDGCGRRFEVRQKFSDVPMEKCEECGGSVKKQISQSAFALKGGGWYQQGYAQQNSCAGASTGNNEACASCPKAANG